MSEEKTGAGSNAEKALATGVEVFIGGTKYFLKYTLWSFCKIDIATGKNPLDGAMWTNPHPQDILTLLWAGLLHSHPELTLEELGNKISLSEIPMIAPLIQKAFIAGSPQTDDEKKSSQNSPVMVESEALESVAA